MLISSWLSAFSNSVTTSRFFSGKNVSRRAAARRSGTCQSTQQIAESLESRALLTINVAVVQDFSGGDNSGFVATTNQLNDDSYFDFNALLVSSSQVDTAVELSAYDVVVVGNNGFNEFDAFNNPTFQAALRTWVESTGGGVVMTGWGIYGNADNARADIDAIIPVNLSGGYNYVSNSATIAISNSSHPITNGLGGSLTITSSGGSSNFVEYAEVGEFGTVLGTVNGSVTLAAADKGSGRGVYLGPIYSASQYNGSFGYGNATLRSGPADRLLEQAVAWAGSASPQIVDVINVSPDPRNTAVSSIDVTLSGPVNGATFTGSDITLTRNGGSNLIDGGVTVSFLSGNTYRISNLASLTAASGSYIITVNGAGITGTNGNAVSGSATDSWAVDVTPPTVTTTSFMASGTLSSSANSMTVTFDELVTGATAAANYLLQRAGIDGLLGTVDDSFVTIASVSLSGSTATLNFATLTEDVYRLTVKQTITDTAGNMLDGDGNGTAGGDWRRDFVVGALSTSLISPNGFALDPEFSGFGAGQLVQGTNNAFDGLNRLAVGGIALSPNANLQSPFDSYSQTFGPVANFSANSGAYITVPGMSLNIQSDGAVTLLESSFALRLLGWGGTTTYAARFLIDGAIAIDAGSVTLAASGGSITNLSINATVAGLTSGSHTVQVQLSKVDSGSILELITGATIKTFDFNLLPDGGSPVDSFSQAFGPVANFSANSGAYYTIPGMSLNVLSDGAVTLLESSFALRLLGWGGTTTYAARFLIDGAIAIDAGQVNLGASFSSITNLSINATVAGLTSGSHTVQVQLSKVDSGSILELITGATIKTFDFNLLPDGGSPVDGYSQAFGPVANITVVAGAYLTIPGMSLNVQSNGAATLLESNFALRLLGWGGTTTYAARFLIDGAIAIDAGSVTLAASGGSITNLSIKATAAGLTSGSHTIQVQLSKVDSGSNLELITGASIKAFDFNLLPSPVLADAGRTVVTAQQSIANFHVYREYTVPASGALDFVRTIDVFVNPTSSEIAVPVRIVGNLGSDAATTVFATSDGDLLVEPTDLWFGTDDADGSGTPAIIHLLHGPYGLRPTTVNVIQDNVEWTYELTVPAVETKRLAHFTVLGTTRAQAIAAANTLVTTNGFGGEAAAFLTEQELASLANFQFNLAPSYTELTNYFIHENAGGNGIVGTLTFVDPNPGDTVSFSLPDGSADNNLFNIAPDGITLRANSSFNFEALEWYVVTIRATDAGGLFTDTTWSINVNDINEAPTLVSLQDVISTLPENSSTSSRIRVADIVVTDDALGTNTLSLSGADADSFEIVGTQLYLRAGVTLDFEPKSAFDVTVLVVDSTLGTTPDLSAAYQLNLENVTEFSELIVQDGQTQRSFVRYLDIVFDQSDGVQDMISSGRIRLTKYDISGLNPTNVLLTPSMFSLGKNNARLDFGTQGLGGNRNTNIGDGYYQLDVDTNNDSFFESAANFHRLLGDLTGDGQVNASDKSQLLQRSGPLAENDVNGDGLLNLSDTSLLSRAFGRKMWWWFNT